MGIGEEGDVDRYHGDALTLKRCETSEFGALMVVDSCEAVPAWEGYSADYAAVEAYDGTDPSLRRVMVDFKCFMPFRFRPPRIRPPASPGLFHPHKAGR